MRKSALVWALAGALLAAVVLVATAPARLLGYVVPGNQLVLEGLDGTLWRGSAARCLLRLSAGDLALGSVRWSLKPLSLLLLSPRLSLQSEWGSQRFSGELVLRGARDLDVRDLEGRANADLVRHFAPLALTGEVSVAVEELQLRNGLPRQGRGRLVWEHGGWQSPQGPVALGTYALDFEQPTGEALRGEVVTVDGPLQAQGSVRLEERRYRLDILLSGDTALNDQLRHALSLVAVPEADGFRIDLQGDF